MNLYLIEGGIGKHIMFSSMINDLSKNEKIGIMSLYPDLFKYHPKVEISVGYNEPEFYKKYKNKINIIHREPYKSNFIVNENHLIYEWVSLYDAEVNSIFPDIYITKTDYENAKKIISNIGDFILVQFSGGQEYNDINKPYVDFKGFIRNYPRSLAQELVNLIKNNNPELNILNFGYPNEPTYNLEGCINTNCSISLMIAISKFASGCICIDSSLQHIFAERNNFKKSIVLWGSTKPGNYGYDKNINLIREIKRIDRPNNIILEDRNNLNWYANELTYMDHDPKYVYNFVKKMIEDNNVVELSEQNIVDIPNDNELMLNDKTFEFLKHLRSQINTFNFQYQTIINTHVAAMNKTGIYTLSEDKKLIRVG